MHYKDGYGEKNNNIEVKNPNGKCCFRYLDDDEIDAIVLERINSTPKRGGSRNGQWTDDELALRNSVVLDLICHKGVSRTEAKKILMQRWGISMSTAERYILAALEELVADYDEFADYSRQQHLQRLEELLEDCLSHNDRKSALTALDQLAKIMSLYTDKKDININSDTISFDFN